MHNKSLIMKELNPNAVGFAWFNSNICLVIWWSDGDFDEDDCDEAGNPSKGVMQANICTVEGISQEDDVHHAMNWGGHFPLFLAEMVIDYCGAWVKTDKTKWRPREETNSPLKLKLKYKSEN